MGAVLGASLSRRLAGVGFQPAPAPARGRAQRPRPPPPPPIAPYRFSPTRTLSSPTPPQCGRAPQPGPVLGRPSGRTAFPRRSPQPDGRRPGRDRCETAAAGRASDREIRVRQGPQSGAWSVCISLGVAQPLAAGPNGRTDYRGTRAVRYPIRRRRRRRTAGQGSLIAAAPGGRRAARSLTAAAPG